MDEDITYVVRIGHRDGSVGRTPHASIEAAASQARIWINAGYEDVTILRVVATPVPMPGSEPEPTTCVYCLNLQHDPKVVHPAR